MLELHKLSCAIDNHYLFTSLSVTVLPASIIYIQGPNGCGKTSLLRMIAGIQKPSNGEIFRKSKKLRPLYIGHDLGLKLELTVLEHLQFWSSVYNSLETLPAAINYFGLIDLLEVKCYKLSAGNKKKLALAKLLACQTDLWLLDEVEANLDETNKKLLHNLITSKANNNGIILLTSHCNHTIIESAAKLYLPDYL